jgi:hypothetical protein
VSKKYEANDLKSEWSRHLAFFPRLSLVLLYDYQDEERKQNNLSQNKYEERKCVKDEWAEEA